LTQPLFVCSGSGKIACSPQGPRKQCMKIAIFGSGYVGLVTGACLADVGHTVVCVDVDPTKVEALKRGEVPIFEPGLSEMIVRNIGQARIAFTTDAKQAIEDAELIFI